MKDTSTGQWNGTCICGHLHSEHKKNIVFNPNWSAGECDVCKICKHFNHQKPVDDVCLSCAENDEVQPNSIHNIRAINCRVKPSDRVFFDLDPVGTICKVRKGAMDDNQFKATVEYQVKLVNEKAWRNGFQDGIASAVSISNEAIESIERVLRKLKEIKSWKNPE